MKLLLSRLALSELDEIRGFIRESSPLGATNVEARIRRAFDDISSYPEAAERVEQRPTVRCLLLAARALPYLIYYEFGSDAVTLLRILHGAPRPQWSDEAQRRR
jgi:plasmid stabilization system protein ParE